MRFLTLEVFGGTLHVSLVLIDGAVEFRAESGTSRCVGAESMDLLLFVSRYFLGMMARLLVPSSEPTELVSWSGYDGEVYRLY